MVRYLVVFFLKQKPCFLCRDLIKGTPEICYNGHDHKPCDNTELNDCKVCHHEGVDYMVGDLIKVQNGGCVKW